MRKSQCIAQKQAPVAFTIVWKAVLCVNKFFNHSTFNLHSFFLLFTYIKRLCEVYVSFRNAARKDTARGPMYEKTDRRDS